MFRAWGSPFRVSGLGFGVFGFGVKDSVKALGFEVGHECFGVSR